MLAIVTASAEANPIGAITSATTNSDWSQGSFSGFVTFDASNCPQGSPCVWRGDLTLQPDRADYPCKAANYLFDGDPNVVVVWSVTNEAWRCNLLSQRRS